MNKKILNIEELKEVLNIIKNKKNIKSINKNINN